MLIPLCALPALRCHLGESGSTRWSAAILLVRFQVTVKGPRLSPNHGYLRSRWRSAKGGDLHDDATTRREKRENSEGR